MRISDQRRRSLAGAFLLLMAGASALTACGDNASSGASPTTAVVATVTTAAPSTPSAPVVFPATVKTTAGDVTVKTKPTHIVSLSPTATEILFSIGAGPQVVAVDDQSNYPATAPKTSLSGFKPNLESIVAEKPDLVVIQFDANGLVAGLKALSVPVIQQPPAGTLDDAYTQMQQLGTLTGNPSGADAAIATMRTKLDTLTRKVTKSATPLTYFHEVDNTLYTATSKTFIGQLYGLLGLTNIADSADKAGSGYPQLSSEYVVSQNPDLIFLADAGCCAQSTKTLAARPGWSGLGAIASNSVIVLDDDLSSRWGPRTPELFETMVNAVAAHSPKPAATSAAK